MQVPKTLKAAGKKFWKSVLAENIVEKAHDLAILEQAAVCLDNAEECREQIEKDGMFRRNKAGNLVENVAIKAETGQKRLFLLLCREMGLTLRRETRRKRLY